MATQEYGPLFPRHEFNAPEYIQTADLGSGNLGAISASDVGPVAKSVLIKAAASSKYNLPPTNRFRCVDGRIPVGGLRQLKGYADPGLAGSIHISESAGELIAGTDMETPMSVRIADSTYSLTNDGLIVVTHGDQHANEEGCGANLNQRNAMGYIGDENNGPVVFGIVNAFGKGLGLSQHLRGDDSEKMRRNAYAATTDDSIWDTAASENVVIAVDNGAEYEELEGVHTEKLAVVSLTPSAFDQQAFLEDNQLDDGTHHKAFSLSLGTYARWRIENRLSYGDANMRQTTLGILAVVTFNVVVPKLLTAEEQGRGEALPVVVMG